MKKLGIQLTVMTVLSLTLYLLRAAGTVFDVFIWALIPLLGAVTAYLCVLGGINPYLAWIMPPVGQTIACLIASAGYLPFGGQMLLTAFVSLIGAAAGDTMEHIRKRKHQ